MILLSHVQNAPSPWWLQDDLWDADDDDAVELPAYPPPSYESFQMSRVPDPVVRSTHIVLYIGYYSSYSAINRNQIVSLPPSEQVAMEGKNPLRRSIIGVW